MSLCQRVMPNAKSVAIVHQKVLSAIEKIGQTLQKLRNEGEELQFHYLESNHQLFTPTMIEALRTILYQCYHQTGSNILKLLEKFRSPTGPPGSQNQLPGLACDRAGASSPTKGILSADINRLDCFSSDEIHLVYTMNLINEGLFDEALQYLKEERVMRVKEQDAPSALVLLSGFKTLLEFISKTNDMSHVMAFLQPFKWCYLELFVETFVFMLMKEGHQERAEHLLYKLGNDEVLSDSKTKQGPILAYNLMKLHLPSPSPELVIHLMERIANIDSGNPLVLELCRKHLHLELPSSQNRSQSDTESHHSDESPSEVLSQVQDRLCRCLDLAMSYIDSVNPAVASSDETQQEAWGILAETTKRICERGSDECVLQVVKLWHKERKAWWPYNHFKCPTTVKTPSDAELLTNKALVCFLLESDKHPFVTSSCQVLPSLDSLLKPLRENKIGLDVRIQETLRIMEENQPDLNSTTSQNPPPVPTDPPQNDKTPSDKFRVSPHSSTVIDFKVPAMGDWLISPLCRGSIHSASMCSIPASTRSSGRSNSSFALLSDSEDEAVQRIIHATELVNSSVASHSDGSDHDVSYVPTNPSVTLKKPLSPWSIRLRSSRNAPDLGESVGTGELDSDDYESAANSSLPAWNNERKTERWKIFLAAGIWEKLEEDPIDSDQDSYLTDVTSMSSDYDDSPTSDSDGNSTSSDLVSSSNVQGESGSPHFPPVVQQSSQQQDPSTPSSQILSGLTPRLDFLDTLPPPREVIPNQDRQAFFDLSETDYSVHNSTTDEIVATISQVIRHLDCDPNDRGNDPGGSQVHEECAAENDLSGELVPPPAEVSRGLSTSRCSAPSPDMFLATSSEIDDDTEIGKGSEETTILAAYASALSSACDSNQNNTITIEDSPPQDKRDSSITSPQPSGIETLLYPAGSQSDSDTSPVGSATNPGFVEMRKEKVVGDTPGTSRERETLVHKLTKKKPKKRQLSEVDRKNAELIESLLRGATSSSKNEEKRSLPSKTATESESRKRETDAPKAPVASSVSNSSAKERTSKKVKPVQSPPSTEKLKRGASSSESIVKSTGKKKLKTKELSDLDKKNANLIESLLKAASSSSKRSDPSSEAKEGTKEPKSSGRGKSLKKPANSKGDKHGKPPRKAHIRVKNPEFWSDSEEEEMELKSIQQVPSSFFVKDNTFASYCQESRVQLHPTKSDSSSSDSETESESSTRLNEDQQMAASGGKQYVRLSFPTKRHDRSSAAAGNQQRSTRTCKSSSSSSSDSDEESTDQLINSILAMAKVSTSVASSSSPKKRRKKVQPAKPGNFKMKKVDAMNDVGSDGSKNKGSRNSEKSTAENLSRPTTKVAEEEPALRKKKKNAASSKAKFTSVNAQMDLINQLLAEANPQ